ncbi:hypothetical protein ACH4NT_34015 [Streptomyces lydicus]|uniref:hypothetical protein n=1 Tax=Streptomyces lydicus TaxID=47763 RepID=UPI00378BB89E
MSLPVLAILVASLSAFGTVMNMIMTIASYRRSGPRLKLTVSYRRLFEPRPDLRNRDRWRGYLHVHVRNYSSVAVEVDVVTLRPFFLPNPFSFGVLFGTRGSIGKSNRFLDPFDSIVDRIEGEEKVAIPAFGGVRWVLDESFTVMTRPGKWESRFLMFRVAVTLTNGREIYSRPMSYLKAKRFSSKVYQALDNAELARAARDVASASLDDASQEQRGET